MAGERVGDNVARAHRGIEWVDRGPWHAKGLAHTFKFENPDRRLRGCHLWHLCFLPLALAL